MEMSLLEIPSICVPILAVLRYAAPQIRLQLTTVRDISFYYCIVYALCRVGEEHPDVQGRLGFTRLVMAPQPPLPRLGPCSGMWTFPANEIGATGLHRPSVLMMIMNDGSGLYFNAAVHKNCFQQGAIKSAL